MNRSKQKGTAHETAVVRWLQSNGHPNAERRTLPPNCGRWRRVVGPIHPDDPDLRVQA